MKMIKIFGLLLFAMFAFNACSDDDDEEVAIELTGTSWETTLYKYGYDGIYNSYDTEEKLISAGYYEILNFNADGVIVSIDSDEISTTGTWSQSGSKVTVTIDEYDTTFTYSGGKLISTETYDQIEFITELEQIVSTEE